VRRLDAHLVRGPWREQGHGCGGSGRGFGLAERRGRRGHAALCSARRTSKRVTSLALPAADQ
jgi:hypothetical protein